MRAVAARYAGKERCNTQQLRSVVHLCTPRTNNENAIIRVLAARSHDTKRDVVTCVMRAIRFGVFFISFFFFFRFFSLYVLPLSLLFTGNGRVIGAPLRMRRPEDQSPSAASAGLMMEVVRHSI